MKKNLLRLQQIIIFNIFTFTIPSTKVLSTPSTSLKKKSKSIRSIPKWWFDWSINQPKMSNKNSVYFNKISLSSDVDKEIKRLLVLVIGIEISFRQFPSICRTYFHAALKTSTILSIFFLWQSVTTKLSTLITPRGHLSLLTLTFLLISNNKTHHLR